MAVLYTARFSFSSSTGDSVVGVLCTLGVDTGLEAKHGDRVSDVLRICLNRVSTSRSLNHSAEKEDCVTEFLHSSHDPHHDLI